jgi:hypothetical protein
MGKGCTAMGKGCTAMGKGCTAMGYYSIEECTNIS